MRIRLEFDDIEIHSAKERWHIYFIFATEHPQDPDQVLVTVLPEETLRFTGKSDNVWSFRPEGKGADGLFVLRREIPESESLYGGLWIRHSKEGVRRAGEVLSSVGDLLGGGVLEGAADLLGTVTPWVTAAKAGFGGIGFIGNVLAQIPDRDLGFVNLSEVFGGEFEGEGSYLDRSQVSSSGEVTLGWRWTVTEVSDVR